MRGNADLICFATLWYGCTWRESVLAREFGIGWYVHKVDVWAKEPENPPFVIQLSGGLLLVSGADS